MSPKYHLKAEPGKFGVKMGQQQDGYESPFFIQGDEIVIGVAAMHNMLMAMARALKQSQGVLIQLEAVKNSKSSQWDMQQMGININHDWLQIIIANNAEILEQINLEEPK